MKTLYMFTKSPWARRDMEEWLPRLDGEDAVLLVQDAVLAVEGAPSKVTQGLGKHQGRLFVLEADMIARGIPTAGHAVVDDAGAVALFSEYQRVVAI